MPPCTLLTMPATGIDPPKRQAQACGRGALCPPLWAMVMPMPCRSTSIHDYPLSYSSHPTSPTAECQTSQNNLPPSSCPPQAGTSIMPDIMMTKPRVHNPYALPQLALRTSDVVSKREMLVLSPAQLQPRGLLAVDQQEWVPDLSQHMSLSPAKAVAWHTPCLPQSVVKWYLIWI